MRWALRPNVSDPNLASPASPASRRDLERQLRLEARFHLTGVLAPPHRPLPKCPVRTPPFLSTLFPTSRRLPNTLSFPARSGRPPDALSHSWSDVQSFRGRHVAHDTSKFHQWSDSSVLLQVVVSILASLYLYTHLFFTSCSIGERRSRHSDYVAPQRSQGVGATLPTSLPNFNSLYIHPC